MFSSVQNIKYQRADEYSYLLYEWSSWLAEIEMGLSDGLIRFSIGLDNDIERTYQTMKECMVEVGVLNPVSTLEGAGIEV